MLIKCPECNREISSAAACCPGCGYPINTPPKPKKQSKKKGGGSKLPNGYGSVYKLSGNRRKPWVAAKRNGKTGTTPYRLLPYEVGSPGRAGEL